MPVQSQPDLNSSLAFLEEYLRGANASSFFVLMDDNVRHYCFDYLLTNCPSLNDAATATIRHGEDRKTLATCEQVYEALLHQRADRHTLLVCLGGGLVTDLGGFVAGTYKRGIEYINIPTTLLGMADAAIGGKTGVNHRGTKNTLGVFKHPSRIVLDPSFLQTLDDRQWLNGYAEVIKHALIADRSFWQRLQTYDDPLQLANKELIQKASAIKQKIVEKDEKETGERKVLNFGHTIGHAIESYFLASPQPLWHGEAIAAGMMCEAFLSTINENLSAEELDAITDYLSRIYTLPQIPPEAYLQLIEWMYQDKKNRSGSIKLTLLQAIGSATFDVDCDESLIIDSLDYYNNLA